MANIYSILKYIIYTGLFAVLFLPFYVDVTMFFPFITGKGFAFRIIVEIITTAWIILFLKDKAYRPKFSWIFVTFAAFILSLSISAILSENSYKSFWSNFERMEGLITTLHLFAFFVVASTMFSTQKLWTRFFNTSLIASLGIALYSFAQLAGKITINQGGVRVDATFGNAAYLAIYLVFHIFFAFFFLLRSENKFHRLAYGSLALIHLFLLYETQTRGAILGLLGGLFITSALVALTEKENPRLRKISWGIIGGIVLLVIGFISIKETSFVRNNPTLVRFAEISLTKDQARTYVWPMAIKGFEERPLFGWGQESFNYVFNKYYDPRMYNHEQWFDRTHNVILDWLVAGGILGLSLYLLLFVFSLKYLWKTDNLSSVEKSVLTGLFVAYFFHNLFVFDNLISYLLFFSLLAYIHSFSGKEWKISAFDINARIQQIISALVIVAFLFILYTANIVPIKANKKLIEAISPRQDGNISLNLEAFKKALSYHSFGDAETREQLAQTTNNIVKAPSISNEFKVQFAELSMSELQKQLTLTPEDTRYQIFAAVSANGFGNYEQGLIYGLQTVKSSPGKQTAYFELGTSYIGKRDYENALETFKKAYELEPSFQDAKIAYIVGAIYAGKKDLEKELLSTLPEQVAYFDDRLFRAYVAKGEYSHVLEILAKRIESDPKNSSHRFSRAAVYLELGNRTRAIKEIEGIIEIQPEFKEQGEFYIKEIRAGRNP